MKKRVVILGGGESGCGAAILAEKKGFDVFLSDASCIKEHYKQLLSEHKVKWEENGHTETLIFNADEIIKSPGIPPSVPLVKELIKRNIPIVSEIEFAGRYNTAKTVCITGSNGKTTTSYLCYHILKKAGLKVGLAGNVGKSFALQVALHNFDYYVIELSSFQLDNMYNFKADIAILLNITPDHLDRYEYKFQNYVDSKMRITQNQTENDSLIYWNEDETIRKELEGLVVKAKKFPFSYQKETNSTAYIEDTSMHLRTPNMTLDIPLESLRLNGKHNMYNSMAAALSANSLYIKKEAIKNALTDFEGVEHRLERVAHVRNVLYINDSKATNINSCWYALESMKQPTVLILGGVDKGNDYQEIDKLVEEKVHSLIFLGKDSSKLNDFFGKKKPCYTVQSMKEAVNTAYKIAKKGDAVLLSPCCASFDLFKNYEDRGTQFKQLVKAL